MNARKINNERRMKKRERKERTKEQQIKTDV